MNKIGAETCLGLPTCMCDNRRQVNSPTIRKVDAAGMASRTVRMRLGNKTWSLLTMILATPPVEQSGLALSSY